MNELFLRLTGFGILVVLFITCAGGAVLVHLAFLASLCRRKAEANYFAFLKKWFFRRSLPVALLLSFIMLLMAVIPATLLARYRTFTIQQWAGSSRCFLLRITDEVAIPDKDGGDLLTNRVSYTTTNSAAIAEFLTAIRFSPTYPLVTCLCRGGSRKFEVLRLRRNEVEFPMIAFTIAHDQNARFENDWYGDWHLSKKSLADLAAWQKKYVDKATASAMTEEKEKRAEREEEKVFQTKPPETEP